jgi:hypothetical protein
MISLKHLRMEKNIKDNGKSLNFNYFIRHKKTKKWDGLGILFWPEGTKYEG